MSEIKDIITLEITEKDVKEGIRASSAYCPTALAAMRYFKKKFPAGTNYEIMIGETFGRFVSIGTYVGFQHSEELVLEIEKWDLTGKFKPGKYDLEIMFARYKGK